MNILDKEDIMNINDLYLEYGKAVAQAKIWQGRVQRIEQELMAKMSEKNNKEDIKEDEEGIE
jgi:hypothetical protein